MAQVITENKVVMGRPQYRFEIEYSEENLGKEYFDAGWIQAVRAYQLYKKDIKIVCREWDRKSEEWIVTTDETIEEGRQRAERSRIANSNKETEPKEIVPTMSDGSIAIIQNAATTLKLVSQAGKKQLPDDETKQMVGMELMQVLTAVGYTVKDMKNLVNQYAHSIDAQPKLPAEVM